jgi:hypothetical protein
MIEVAAFPEKPTLLMICRTCNGRALEQLLHAELRKHDRKFATAPGTEWFMTNEHEVVEICKQLLPEVPKLDSKPLSGASPDLSDLAEGTQVELTQNPHSACVFIRIIEPKPT